MPDLTLGLDLGANSIGWALIDETGQRLVATGVRVFPEGVDNYDTGKEAPKMQERRIKRAMRRLIMRRAARRRALRRLLADAGLCQADDPRLWTEDPYELRRRGLDEPLTGVQFARVLIHLAQRRGFKSNRKTDRAREADDKGVLGEINWVQQQIAVSGSRTLGEMLAKVRAGEWHSPDAVKLHTRVRAIHTRREMFLHEFDMLWERQKSFNSPLSALLTDELKLRLNNPAKDDKWMHKGILFGQRKLYWPKEVVGRCELEPRLARCPRADRLAQRFRLLQEVNNLRYYDPDAREERTLTQEQRALLLDKLSRTATMDFDAIRKALGFIDSIRFNLERGQRPALKGLPVDAALACKEIFGRRWHEFSEQQKDQIVRTLIDESDEDLRRIAVEQWGLSPQAAEKLLTVELPDGYAALSRQALEKLLPHMERGLLYMTADGTPCALSEAGYLRPDQRPRKTLPFLPAPPEVANPVVRQALHEVRKLVNAIIRQYGKPARIRVELAREAALSADQRRKASKRRQENEDERNRAADTIRQAGGTVSRDAIERVLLWQEQDGACIYSGRPISLAQLLGGEVDIDHILPRSRCLDNSRQNKVVAFRDMNREKGNRTPREWLEADPARYDQVLQRASRLSYAKRRRFIQKELDLDQFVQRQLNDTRHLSRVVRQYLDCLVEQPHHILCPKGSHTAELRRHWGLDTILQSLPDSPAWQAADDLQPGEKNRADHRHHAIDAVVLALTDHKRLQQLARIQRQGGTRATGQVLPEPWPGFRDAVLQAVQSINVSHRVQRRVAGALHEETIYGPVFQRRLGLGIVQKPGEFVFRKPLESLSAPEIEHIRDKTIRQIVIDRLKERNVAFGRGAKKKTIPSSVWNPPLAMPSGVPIRKVRLLKYDQTIQPIRNGTAYVKTGSIHHLCIFQFTENGKRKREAVFVSMLEAAQRIRLRQPIIQRTHPTRPNATFVMSLSRGEMVLGTFKGKLRLVKLKTAVSTEQKIQFVEHTDARRGNLAQIISVTPNTLKGEKVTVDLLGRIRRAHD